MPGAHGNDIVEPGKIRVSGLESRCNAEIVADWIDYLAVFDLVEDGGGTMANAAIAHRDQRPFIGFDGETSISVCEEVALRPNTGDWPNDVCNPGFGSVSSTFRRLP